MTITKFGHEYYLNSVSSKVHKSSVVIHSLDRKKKTLLKP